MTELAPPVSRLLSVDLVMLDNNYNASKSTRVSKSIGYPNSLLCWLRKFLFLFLCPFSVYLIAQK